MIIKKNRYETFGDSKLTATMVASLRHSTTFHPYELKGTDYLAKHFISPEMSYFVESPFCRWIMYSILKYLPFSGNTLGEVISRTFVMDSIIKDEIINKNAKQLVIFGGGFDTRAIRFKEIILKYGIKVFELDLIQTQKLKIELLIKNNLFSNEIKSYYNLISINFENDSINDVLLNNGFILNKQTIFLLEGVSYYLSEEALKNTLSFVSIIGGKHSLIIWDTFHYCFLSKVGQMRSNRHKNDNTYCKKYKSYIPSYLGFITHTFMDTFLGEPFKFGLNYTFENPLLKSNTNPLFTFHQNLCLDLENVYEATEMMKYLSKNDRKLFDMKAGSAVVTARKIENCQIKV